MEQIVFLDKDASRVVLRRKPTFPHEWREYPHTPQEVMAERLRFVFKSGHTEEVNVKSWTYERDRRGDRSLEWTRLDGDTRIVYFEMDEVVMLTSTTLDGSDGR